jgi:hypothetical protein
MLMIFSHLQNMPYCFIAEKWRFQEFIDKLAAIKSFFLPSLNPTRNGSLYLVILLEYFCLPQSDSVGAGLDLFGGLTVLLEEPVFALPLPPDRSPAWTPAPESRVSDLLADADTGSLMRDAL